mgnify:CR=1 FL=1
MLKVLLALVALSGITGVAQAADKPFGERSIMSESNIAERVSRTGTVCLKGEECAGAVMSSGAEEAEAPAEVATGPRAGDAIFNTYCTACHSTGAAGAPKVGDAAAWTAHLEANGNDFEALWKSGWNGKGAMPSKGMCADCSEEEFSGAVQYMLDQSK